MSKPFISPLTTPEKTQNPVPSVDFDQIKKTTDIVRVVESYGVTLKKGAKEFVGRCPFHEDNSGHLYVNREKGVFYCQKCGETGNVIQFVAKKEGISEKEAALKLCSQIPGVRRGVDVARSMIEVRRSMVSEGERAKLLQRVVAFYVQTLHGKDRAGLDYLKSRKLDDPAMLEVFQVGYCNGTLHEALPKSGEIIEQLKAIGILDARGREMLRGRVTVPIFDANGNVVNLYARNIHPCEPEDRHRYLIGPRRGVFNSASLKTAQTAFITEAIFDAMALWAAGFRNAIALYGNKGWTPEHEKLFRENPLSEVVLALDNDAASREQTQRLREKLLGIVKTVHVIAWPEGVKDAADFFLSRSAADFEALPEAANPTSEKNHRGTESTEKEQIEMTANGFNVAFDGRRYELKAIEKPSASRLKATVKATSNVERGSSNAGAARFHIDTVDFYLNRQRKAFVTEAARFFRAETETVETDLNRLIVHLETYVAKRLEEKTPRVILVSEADKAEGYKLGRDPNLVLEILGDGKKLGIVGEEPNTLLNYLGVTSRKLDDPLAIHTLASSGAGKSFLLDAILSLCPPEDLIRVTSLSAKALFYMGERSLVHKVLALEEVAGALGARYAIRSLLSEKVLKSETTIKNPLTGRMETQQSVVYGAPAYFETTTDPETDEETRSRLIIQTVDESVEQTLAILEAQRNSHTVEGWERKLARAAILARHHAFQRLLRPLRVVNRFEPLLGYGDGRLLFRRDHPKYLNLILAITFLFQMQRPIKQSATLGEHIEVTLDDIALANELALELFGHSLDDLSPPSRELLRLIREYVQRRAAELKIAADKVEFHRRELRQALRWSETQLRRYLRALVEMEYLAPVAGRHGQLYSYRLIFDGKEDEGRHLPGLKSVEQIRVEAIEKGILPADTPQTSPRKMALRQEKSNFANTSPSDFGEVPEGVFHRENGNGEANFASFSGGHIPVFGENGSVIAKEVGAAR